MKKRLFLHIGSHKTATTYLQNSFSASPIALSELGLLYPMTGRIYGGHFKLCWALKDRDLAAQKLEDFQIWSDLMAEIDASPHQVALISAEEFGWDVDPARLYVLAKRYDVQVIFYLRSPDSHLESFYNQVVKDFATKESRPLETYMAEQNLAILDTTKILAPWAELFGPKAIKLRLFGKSFMPDGIMTDILQTMGFARVPTFNPSPDSALQKVSLPPDALEYLRLSNPYLTKADGHHDFVIRLVRLTQANPDLFQQTRSGILSPRARQALRARFRATQLQAVHSYLGPGRSPFPPTEAPDFPGYETRLPEADARVLGKVAALIRTIT